MKHRQCSVFQKFGGHAKRGDMVMGNKLKTESSIHHRGQASIILVSFNTPVSLYFARCLAHISHLFPLTNADQDSMLNISSRESN
jgi:hypothetical protein